ncbi:MAG: CGGC domain-containing protein [Syntrophaceae bacterium]
MARIGILTCSNCTRETNCASVVCLADMRKRAGFFDCYKDDPALDLIGIISCAGCPTVAAPEKILKRARAVADFRIDALHFANCVVALCPFRKKYQEIIKKEYPALEIVMGTHRPADEGQFRADVKELLCPSVVKVQAMTDVIKGTLKRQE